MKMEGEERRSRRNGKEGRGWKEGEGRKGQ